jgi:hypothetical protein
MHDLQSRLLLWAVAAGPGRGQAPAWLPGKLAPRAGARLVEGAVREGTAGFLYRRLKGAGRLDLLPSSAASRLESVYYLTVRTNLELLSVVDEIFARQIPVVLIQGAALLVRLYADPGLRPVTDIDLWALPTDKGRALAALARLGFRGDPVLPGLLRRGELLIDFHTHLLGAERIRARRFLLGAAQEQVFRACRHYHREGGEIRCLDPLDQVLHATYHAVKHNFERLVWAADLDHMVTGWGAADWAALRQRAGELGQGRLVALLSSLRREVFGCAPAWAAGPKAGVSPLSRHLLRRRRHGPLPAWSSLVLLSAGGPARQFAFALESALPRPDVLRQVFPDHAGLSDCRLYGKRVRQLLGMLRGGSNPTA